MCKKKWKNGKKKRGSRSTRKKTYFLRSRSLYRSKRNLPSALFFPSLSPCFSKMDAYEKGETLGQGTFGIVYKAVHKEVKKEKKERNEV